MKTNLRVTVSAAAMSLMMSYGAASAADFFPPPSPPMPVSSWTGPYVGIFVGGVLPDFNNHWNPGLNDCSGPTCVPTFNAVNDLEDAGANLGVRFGYDHQIGMFVLGVEADASKVWLENNTYYFPPFQPDEPDSSNRAGLNIDALASVRGRLGIAFDDFLVYGSGGVGYVHSNFTASTSGTDPVQGIQSLSTWAPVIGGGVEWKVLANASIGANVFHYFVDNKRSFGDFGDGNGTDSFVDFKGLTTVDVSLKYRF